MARPRIEIDLEQFKGLCNLQCTLVEIAAFFKCSIDTIERWCKRELNMSFAESYKMYSAGGKISIRRWQMKMAEHNATMAIWLGKQYLGQTEKQDVAINLVEDDSTLAMAEFFAKKKSESNEDD